MLFEYSIIHNIFFSVTLVTSWRESLNYTTKYSCASNQYYDIGLLQCLPCNRNVSLITSPDGFSCVCDKKSHIIHNGITGFPICSTCRSNEIVSLDQRHCVPRKCIERKKGHPTCLVCGKHQISVTHNVDGAPLKEVRCVTCTPGLRPSADKTICIPCETLAGTAAGKKCFCNTTSHESISGICITKEYLQNRDVYKPKRAGIFWDSTSSMRSLILSEYLCINNNQTACRALANMCVAVFFDMDHKGPCRLWGKTVPQAGLPWLLYGENDAHSVLNEQLVPAEFGLKSSAQNSEINLLAAAYSLDGSGVGYQERLSDWALLCPCPIPVKRFPYAYNYRYQCKVSVTELMKEDKKAVFAPFLRYTSRLGKILLHAVPVSIKFKGQDYFKNTDGSNLQLFRRFLQVLRPEYVAANNSVDVLVWYLKSFTVNVKVHRSKLYSPLLELEYDAVRRNELDEDVTLSFALVHQLQGAGMLHALEVRSLDLCCNFFQISAGVLSAVGVLYALLQTWTYGRRSGDSGAALLAVFFLHLCANTANVFFLVSWSAATHNLLLFKVQSSVLSLPPSPHEETVLLALLCTACCLKLTEVVWMNWWQVTLDIFFLDWEFAQSGNRGDTRTEERSWRVECVMRAWCLMQTSRRICLPIHLLIVVFILELTDNWWCKEAPSYKMSAAGCTWMALYTLQAIVSVVLRRWSQPLLFVKMCSAARISMLVFRENLYAHYVHGRSVKGEDTQGLLPGRPDQVFSMCCAPSFRILYKKLQYQALTSKHSRFSHVPVASTANLVPKHDIDMDEMTWQHTPLQKSRLLLTTFLSSFFDHALDEYEYRARERRLLERFLDTELGPVEDFPGISTLLYDNNDTGMSYVGAIWYGQEWTLAMFDLTLFLVIQLLSDSSLLAGFVSVVIWKIMTLVRYHAGTRNVIQKSLIENTVSF